MWKYFVLFSVSALVGMVCVFIPPLLVPDPTCYYFWAAFGIIFLCLGCLGLGMWIQEHYCEKKK